MGEVVTTDNITLSHITCDAVWVEMCYVTVVLVLSVVTYTERVTATCVCDFDQ